MRTFANNWHKEKEKYIEEVSDMEREFKDKLLAYFQIGHITPLKRKR